MKFRKTLAAVGVLALATSAPMVIAPAASAATVYTMHTDDGDPGGRVKFWPDGDVVELCDIEADGWAVQVSVTDWTQRKFKYDYQLGGDGRCQTLRASLGAPYDLAEGNVIRFTICLDKSDRDPAYCDTSDWANVN